jgi:ABC-2 type transport system ATP-binding protein
MEDVGRSAAAPDQSETGVDEKIAPVPSPEPETAPSPAPCPAPSPQPPAALELRGLRKSFGDTLAVDEVDLSVPPGSFFGLVGPNGAGKTTAFAVLSAAGTAG